jgi:hypothetical protein
MFSEWKCGCIDSPAVGLVRFCPVHAKARDAEVAGNRVALKYPSHGVMPRVWNGGK